MINMSHNSMSYLPVKQWWAKPFGWMAKCQDLSIAEQYRAGVRGFDFKMRPVGNSMAFTHGITVYDDVQEGGVMAVFAWLAHKGDCSVGIVLDERRSDHNNENEMKFERFVSMVTELYCDRIDIHGGNRLYDGKVLVNISDPVNNSGNSFKGTKGGIAKFSSCKDNGRFAWRNLLAWYPRIYAYVCNQYLSVKYREWNVMADFIGKYYDREDGTVTQ